MMTLRSLPTPKTCHCYHWASLPTLFCCHLFFSVLWQVSKNKYTSTDLPAHLLIAFKGYPKKWYARKNEEWLEHVCTRGFPRKILSQSVVPSSQTIRLLAIQPHFWSMLTFIFIFSLHSNVVFVVYVKYI